MPKKVEVPKLPTKPATVKFKRLKALPPDKFVAMEEMLRDGFSPLHVAREMQGTLGQCTEVSEYALTKMLYRYVEQEMDIRTAAKAFTSQATRRVLQKLKQNVDAVVEMEALVIYQRERLDQAREKERLGKVLFKGLSTEVKEYGILLKNLLDMQMDTGIVRRIPKEVKGHLGVYNLNSMGRDIIEQGAEGQRAIDAATQNAISIIDGEFNRVVEGNPNPEVVEAEAVA